MGNNFSINQNQNNIPYNNQSKRMNAEMHNNENIHLIQSIFGPPDSYNFQGMAIWNKRTLYGKMFLGMPTYFEYIMVKEDHKIGSGRKESFIYLVIKVPATSRNEDNLLKLSIDIGYDMRNEYLWVRSTTLGGALVLMKYATEIIAENYPVYEIIGANLVNIDTRKITNANGELNKCFARRVCQSIWANISKINYEIAPDKMMLGRHEHFSEPWYERNDPRASNQPAQLAELHDSNAQFYTDYDRYMASRNVAKKPNAFPQAPGAKPTLYNYNNLGQKKKEAMLSEPKKKQSKMEKLISYNAYKHVWKQPTTSNSLLGMLGATTDSSISQTARSNKIGSLGEENFTNFSGNPLNFLNHKSENYIDYQDYAGFWKKPTTQNSLIGML